MKKFKLLALSLALAGLVLPNGMEASNGLGSSDEMQSSPGSAFSDSSKTKKSSKHKKKKKKVTSPTTVTQPKEEEEWGECNEGHVINHELIPAVETAPEPPTPTAPPKPKKDEVWTIVEQPPSFPGGEQAFMQWISQNIDYPIRAYENGISGRVIVSFIVEKDGSISNVQVVKGIDKDLDAEAIRVVKKMPKWNPGKQNGEVVRVFFNLPVTFKLAEVNTDSTPESGDGVTVKSVGNR